MSRNAVIPVVTPVGEWQLGPRNQIVFSSMPVAPASRTVDVAWGETMLRVRVIERVALQSHGVVLGRRVVGARRSPRGHDAGALVERGLEALAGTKRC